MNRRRIVSAIALVPILLTMLLAMVGCGGATATTATQSVTATVAASSSTTMTAPTTTTTMATTTTTEAATSTTSATGPSTASTIAMTPDVVKYVADFMAWTNAIQGIASQLGGLEMARDVTKISAADLKAAEASVAVVHKFADQLRRIKAPAVVAAVHQKVVAGFDDLVAILDKELRAMRNKDQAGVEAAMAEGEAQTAFANAMEEWSLLLAGTTPVT